VEDQFAALEDDQQPANDEIKTLMTTQFQLKFQAKILGDDPEF